MKIKVELECTPDEAKELFVPGDKNTEFMHLLYNSYVDVLQKTVKQHIDPYNFTGINDNV